MIAIGKHYELLPIPLITSYRKISSLVATSHLINNRGKHMETLITNDAIADSVSRPLEAQTCTRK